MNRPLGSFETALTLTGEHAPFVVVIVLRLDTGPSPGRLRSALGALQTCQPMLRVRIAHDAGRSAPYRFESEGVPEIPVRQVTRQDEITWRRATEDELAQSLDTASGPLVRCVHVAPGDGDGACEILLTFHHTVMDATSGAALLRQLLALLDPGAGPQAPPQSPPPSEAQTPTLFPVVEERVPAPYRGLRRAARLAGFLARQIGDEVRFRWRSRGLRRPPIVEPARCRILPVELSAEASAALVRALRRERVTVNAALSAALLLAIHRHLYDGRPRPLRYLTFADLRPYLRPPIAEDRLGCAITMLRYTAELEASHGDPAEPGSGFWPLARSISRQVDAGVRRGDRFFSMAMSERLMRTILRHRSERMAATAVSFSGVMRLDDPTEERDLRVRSSHAFVSNLGLGPEYSAQGRWFRDRLQLDMVYLESDLDEPGAQAVAEDVLRTLERAGEVEGSPREEAR